MADRLKIVPVRVDDEGPVIVRVIVRSDPRRAVVDSAGRQSRPIEGVDFGPGVGGQRKMQRA